MKRDMELIKKIVFEIQSWETTHPHDLTIHDYDPNIVGRHVEILINAGYVDGQVAKSISGSISPFVTDLSWEGHDFAAALQNEGAWAKLKEKLSPSELATLPLPIVKDLLMSLLKTYLMHKVGVPA